MGKEWIEYYEKYGGPYFYELVKLKEDACGIRVLVIPHGVEKIGHNCFEDSRAEAIVFKNGVKQIGKEAFKNCKNLRYVYLPDSVEVIGRDAFLGCEKAEIFCEEEGYCWVHPEKFEEMFLSDAFNFHRSSGSWDTPPVPEPVSDSDLRPYNPLNRPVHRNVTWQAFKEILTAAGLCDESF